MRLRRNPQSYVALLFDFYRDMPPPGGFEMIKYKRNLPFRGPSSAVILAGVFGVCAYGFYRLGKGNQEKRLVSPIYLFFAFPLSLPVLFLPSFIRYPPSPSDSSLHCHLSPYPHFPIRPHLHQPSSGVLSSLFAVTYFSSSAIHRRSRACDNNEWPA